MIVSHSTTLTPAGSDPKAKFGTTRVSTGKSLTTSSFGPVGITTFGRSSFFVGFRVLNANEFYSGIHHRSYDGIWTNRICAILNRRVLLSRRRLGSRRVAR